MGYPSITGPERHDGVINHVLPAWDIICGQTAAMGLLAAGRHGDRTSEGQFIKLALAMLRFLLLLPLDTSLRRKFLTRNVNVSEMNSTEPSAETTQQLTGEK